VHIRPTTSDDLAAISELENVIFPDPWPFSAFEEALADEECCQLVAEYDGWIVGYAVYLTDGTESRVANIAVAPEYRRKSVAKQLLRHILDVVSETDCSLVLLEVRPSNFEARELYGEFGFRDLYRKPNYYRRPVEDALVMVRHLKDD
jgi:ribosomal-protein-alanine N-acetyltransferase